MKYKYRAFFACFSLTILFAFKVQADIELLQPFIFLGENIIEYKDVLEQVQGAKQDLEQLHAQVSSTISSAEGTVKSAKEKAETIIKKAQDISQAVKEGDAEGVVASLELSGLKGMFDGTKGAYETEDKIREVMVRQSGDHSIENQKALSKTLNEKEGKDMTNLFAEALVERQNIMKEKDKLGTPQSIDAAINLSQEQEVYSLSRLRKMAKYDAVYEEYLLTKSVESIASKGSKDD